MAKLDSLNFRRSVVVALIGAVIAGFAALAVNFYVTSTTFRRDLNQQRRLQLTRSSNFLVIVRDELASVERNLTDGSLTAKLDGPRIVRTTARWPTQVWSVARWNDDLLNMESALLRSIASIYDEIFRLDGLLDNAYQMESMGAAMSGMLRAMAEGDASMRPGIERALNTPSPTTVALLASYTEGVERIKKRIPDVLTALDIKIKELQRELQ